MSARVVCITHPSGRCDEIRAHFVRCCFKSVSTSAETWRTIMSSVLDTKASKRSTMTSNTVPTGPLFARKPKGSFISFCSFAFKSRLSLKSAVISTKNCRQLEPDLAKIATYKLVAPAFQRCNEERPAQVGLYQPFQTCFTGCQFCLVDMRSTPRVP